MVPSSSSFTGSADSGRLLPPPLPAPLLAPLYPSPAPPPLPLPPLPPPRRDFFASKYSASCCEGKQLGKSRMQAVQHVPMGEHIPARQWPHRHYRSSSSLQRRS